VRASCTGGRRHPHWSTHPTFDVKLRKILAREPLPDLRLVTNRCGE
jgi:hypothetical protein